MTALPRSRLSPITFDGTPTVPARHTTTPVVWPEVEPAAAGVVADRPRTRSWVPSGRSAAGE
ncbi:hypothetical protein, partial [Prescottella equi]